MDNGPRSEPDEMVLDPSLTPWRRQLGISSPTQPVTPSLSKEKCSAPGDEDGGHPRKKRKSDIGSIVLSGSVVHATSEAEAAQVVSTSTDSVHEPGRKSSARPSNLTQIPLRGAATKTENPRKIFRSHIAGFVHSGSQIQPRPSPSSGDKLDELEDDRLNMDEDEDMIKNKGVEIDVDKRDCTSSMPLRAAVNHHRQSSPEAARRVPEVVRDDASPVDLPTSVLGDDYEADKDSNSALSQALASSYEEPSIISQKNKIYCPEVIRTEKDVSDLSLQFRT